jgi:redox-sensing transcriptional repressor
MDSTPGQGRWPDDPAAETPQPPLPSGPLPASRSGPPPPLRSGTQPAPHAGVVGDGERAVGDGGEVHRGVRRIPEATVARLPIYLRCLVEVADAKIATISSERLAEMAGVNAAKVRKDLSHLGSYGTRGVGYEVEYLLVQISRVLGLTQDCPVVIVGVGNLGHALANYRGFSARGFRIAALVDADPRKVGERVGDLVVRDLESLPEIVEPACIGIIATPAAAAQDVADRLVAAGVTSILNFAPAVISVPNGISMRKVDLSIELQILSFYQQRRSPGLARAGAAAAEGALLGPLGGGTPPGPAGSGGLATEEAVAGPQDAPTGDGQGAAL